MGAASAAHSTLLQGTSPCQAWRNGLGLELGKWMRKCKPLDLPARWRVAAAQGEWPSWWQQSPLLISEQSRFFQALNCLSAVNILPAELLCQQDI